MTEELTVKMLEERLCVYGYFRIYEVGAWRVRLVLDMPLFTGCSYMAEVYDRANNAVLGTAGFGATDEEAVRESLTKWVRIEKPPTIKIPLPIDMEHTE